MQYFSNYWETCHHNFVDCRNNDFVYSVARKFEFQKSCDIDLSKQVTSVYTTPLYPWTSSCWFCVDIVKCLPHTNTNQTITHKVLKISNNTFIRFAMPWQTSTNVITQLYWASAGHTLNNKTRQYWWSAAHTVALTLIIVKPHFH